MIPVFPSASAEPGTILFLPIDMLKRALDGTLTEAEIEARAEELGIIRGVKA